MLKIAGFNPCLPWPQTLTLCEKQKYKQALFFIVTQLLTVCLLVLYFLELCGWKIKSMNTGAQNVHIPRSLDPSWTLNSVCQDSKSVLFCCASGYWSSIQTEILPDLKYFLVFILRNILLFSLFPFSLWSILNSQSWFTAAVRGVTIINVSEFVLYMN